jgi:hypothetical protein
MSYKILNRTLLKIQQRNDTITPLIIVSMVVMTVVHSIEVSTLYPHVVISSPFHDKKTSMLHASQAQSHFRGVRPGDHYMPLQRLTIGISHV